MWGGKVEARRSHNRRSRPKMLLAPLMLAAEPPPTCTPLANASLASATLSTFPGVGAIGCCDLCAYDPTKYCAGFTVTSNGTCYLKSALTPVQQLPGAQSGFLSAAPSFVPVNGARLTSNPLAMYPVSANPVSAVPACAILCASTHACAAFFVSNITCSLHGTLSSAEPLATALGGRWSDTPTHFANPFGAAGCLAAEISNSVPGVIA